MVKHFKIILVALAVFQAKYSMSASTTMDMSGIVGRLVPAGMALVSKKSLALGVAASVATTATASGLLRSVGSQFGLCDSAQAIKAKEEKALLDFAQQQASAQLAQHIDFAQQQASAQLAQHMREQEDALRVRLKREQARQEAEEREEADRIKLSIEFLQRFQEREQEECQQHAKAVQAQSQVLIGRQLPAEQKQHALVEQKMSDQGLEEVKRALADQKQAFDALKNASENSVEETKALRNEFAHLRDELAQSKRVSACDKFCGYMKNFGLFSAGWCAGVANAVMARQWAFSRPSGYENIG
jgi:hypothetical protein